MKLTNDNELLSFMRAYREALLYNDYPQPLTYRDIMDMNDFVANGAFSIAEAIDINLIKGSKPDKLAKIEAFLMEKIGGRNRYLDTYRKLIGELR